MADEEMALLERVEKGADANLVRDTLAFAAGRIMAAGAEVAADTAEDAPRPLREVLRSGQRGGDWDTRAGRIELAIPRLRKGSEFSNFRALADRRGGLGDRGAGGLVPRHLHARRR